MQSVCFMKYKLVLVLGLSDSMQLDPVISRTNVSAPSHFINLTSILTRSGQGQMKAFAAKWIRFSSVQD